MGDLARPGKPLQALLASSLAKYQNHVSEDLTAVVLRAVGSESVQKAGVA